MHDDSDPREAGPKPPFDEPAQDESPGRETSMRNTPDHGEESYVGAGRMTGRVALVTGGDSGIGRAVALAFAREGADVGIASTFTAKVCRTRAASSSSNRSTFLPWIAASMKKAFGRIDVLVNNAAFQGKKVERFEELDAARVRHTFAVNVEAMFHLVRECLPLMRPGAVIINVASVQADHPTPGILDYAATKGAIVTFTKGLAQTLVERGIRVNAVAPGPVWTPLVAQSFDEEELRTFGEGSPMGRPAQPAELAPAFVFLATSASSFVNGEVLGVTGGKPIG
jgi:NAD(P)-dependent dehydrogenase (short-subunit alcohol dehydrogenase family)